MSRKIGVYIEALLPMVFLAAARQMSTRVLCPSLLRPASAPCDIGRPLRFVAAMTL
jgi:hypothetical protein